MMPPTIYSYKFNFKDLFKWWWCLLINALPSFILIISEPKKIKYKGDGNHYYNRAMCMLLLRTLLFAFINFVIFVMCEIHKKMSTQRKFPVLQYLIIKVMLWGSTFLIIQSSLNCKWAYYTSFHSYAYSICTWCQLGNDL